MKNTIFSLLGAGALTAAMLSFSVPRPATASHAPRTTLNPTVQVSATSIKGKVDPADGANFVVAISATDSTRAIITDGMFMINTKPGAYKVIVVAKSPYKDAVKDNVEVADGNTTDLGTIALQQ